MRQLSDIGLVEKVGLPVNQVQAFRICHPVFGAGSGHAKQRVRRSRRIP